MEKNYHLKKCSRIVVQLKAIFIKLVKKKKRKILKKLNKIIIMNKKMMMSHRLLLQFKNKLKDKKFNNRKIIIIKLY